MIGFGALNVGMALKDENVRKNLEKKKINLQDAHEAIQSAWECPNGSWYALSLDWGEFLSYSGRLDDPKYKYVASECSKDSYSVMLNMSLLAPDERKALIHKILVETFAQALECDKSEIDDERPTNTLGADSLSTIMISAILNQKLGSRLTYSQITGDSSIKALASTIFEGSE